jgi:antitoxin CptB
LSPRDSGDAAQARQRLRWRCRRGMKELDVLLERYLARRYEQAPALERRRFAALLEQEDPVIWAWTMDYAAIPAEFSDVIEQLRIHH